MKVKILALLLAWSLVGTMTMPLFAQQADNPNVDEITVPEGTEFKLQLHTTLNSNTSKAGDRIMCSLIDPVAVEDRDVLSKGVRIDGHVCMAQHPVPLDAPLPDPMQLLNRALANEKKTAAEQERYECRVTAWSAETDKNGKMKKQETDVNEQFFVNGQQIERLLEKDGKDLTAEQTRKEDQRVMKETLKYSDKAKADKQEAKDNQNAVDVISAMMLTNGHRELVNGRNVLFYSIVPNPHFKAKNLEQHFASVMQGKVSIDEESGEMIDLDVHSVQDIKIAGRDCHAAQGILAAYSFHAASRRGVAERPGGRHWGCAGHAVPASLFPVPAEDGGLSSLRRHGAAGGAGDGGEEVRGRILLV